MSLSKALLFILLCTGATAQAAEPRPLFNGKDLTGWVGYLDKDARNADGKLRITDVFQVDRARKTIHVDGKGVTFGYIRTVKDYTSFKLHVEWRWLEAGRNNGGIFLRTTGGGGDRTYPQAYEVEIAQYENVQVGDLVIIGYDKASFKTDPARISSWGAEVNGYKGFMWQGAVRKRIVDAERPIGEWNAFDITLDRDSIRVLLNDVLVNESTGAQVLPGGIALQVEGAPIEYRNIVVTPLPD